MIKKLLLFSAIVFPHLLWGQKQDYISARRTVVITTGDSLIEMSVLNGISSDTRINPDLRYYWYESSMVHSNQGGYSGALLDGDYFIYTLKDHALIGSGKFVYGLKDGEWKSWDKAGNIIERSNWGKGRLDGERIIYRNGSVLIYEQYKNGLLQGKTLTKNPDGSITERHFSKGIEKVTECNTPGLKEKNKRDKTRAGKLKQIFKIKDRKSNNGQDGVPGNSSRKSE